MAVTRRMCELTWTEDDHAWLSQRNRSVLRQTAAGRDELRQFDECDSGGSAPLLMDGRKKNSKGEDGAEQYNARELRKLAARTGRPIAAIGAYHDRPQGASNLRPELILEDDFKGLAACVELCVGARVILTQNRWVEAGLMNGALGVVRGFLWPRNGDPNSPVSRLRAPLCVFVEFDEVELGRDAATGQRRSFFPNDDEKRGWVPIYRNKMDSSSEEGVSREQFPLTLAWALTHWKAQGMTLNRVRICLGKKIAAVPGIGYVAVTRVRHPSHLVFDHDLPAWEVFQAARSKADFRARMRYDLRLAARFSRTLRKYRFCEADSWEVSEASAAAALPSPTASSSFSRSSTACSSPLRGA